MKLASLSLLKSRAICFPSKQNPIPQSKYRVRMVRFCGFAIPDDLGLRCTLYDDFHSHFALFLSILSPIFPLLRLPEHPVHSYSRILSRRRLFRPQAKPPNTRNVSQARHADVMGIVLVPEYPAAFDRVHGQYC